MKQNAQFTSEQAQAILDALSDDPSNEEEEELLEQNNPVLYSGIVALRKIVAP